MSLISTTLARRDLHRKKTLVPQPNLSDNGGQEEEYMPDRFRLLLLVGNWNQLTGNQKTEYITHHCQFVIDSVRNEKVKALKHIFNSKVI